MKNRLCQFARCFQNVSLIISGNVESISLILQPVEGFD
jgi:hypothetical protein